MAKLKDLNKEMLKMKTIKDRVDFINKKKLKKLKNEN
jgi:hypothetical protein